MRLVTSSICHLARERARICSSDQRGGSEEKTNSYHARKSVSSLSSRCCLLAFLRALARARSAASGESAQAISRPAKRLPSSSKAPARRGSAQRRLFEPGHHVQTLALLIRAGGADGRPGAPPPGLLVATRKQLASSDARLGRRLAHHLD